MRKLSFSDQIFCGADLRIGLGSMNKDTIDKEKCNEDIFRAVLFDDLEAMDKILDVSSNNYILQAKRVDDLQRFVSLTHLSHNRTALFVACQHGKERIVSRLLKCGACPVEQKDSDGWSPLFVACYNGHKGCIRTPHLLTSQG